MYVSSIDGGSRKSPQLGVLHIIQSVQTAINCDLLAAFFVLLASFI